MTVYLASDHAGFALKSAIAAFVRDELHMVVEDCGPAALEAGDDYPDFISIAGRALAADVAADTESFAIVLGASGQGEAMVMNRFAGVRCAVYYGEAGEQTDASGHALDIISSARAHNDANALSLAARFITPDDAQAAVRRFLQTPFSGDERHLRRIKKIDALTRR